jgi:outer membrane receptor for ferrienterochelin and colicin
MKTLKFLAMATAIIASPVFAKANANSTLATDALAQITAQSVDQAANDITLVLKQDIAVNVKQDVPKISKKRGATLVAREKAVSELARPLMGE